MPKLMGNLPRERITMTIDSELLAVARVLKEESGLSMSMMIEELMLCGLKSKLKGQKVEFEVKIKDAEGIKCQ